MPGGAGRCILQPCCCVAVGHAAGAGGRTWRLLSRSAAAVGPGRALGCGAREREGARESCSRGDAREGRHDEEEAGHRGREQAGKIQLPDRRNVRVRYEYVWFRYAGM